MATSGTFNTSDYNGRYLVFSWALESQSVDNNSSVISWSLRGAGISSEEYYSAGNFKVVINGEIVYQSSTRIDLYNGTIVSSGTAEINHSGDGSKTFTASAEGAIYYTSVNCSGSGAWQLPTISRNATITAADSFTDEQDAALSFVNPSGARLRFTLGVGDTVIATRTESAPRSPYRFNLTTSEKDALLNASPSSNTLTVTYKLMTIIDGSVVNTDSKTAIMRIVNADPTISGVTYKDLNPTTKAITQNDQLIIQDKSTLRVTLASITALKGATLGNVKVSINGVEVTSGLTGSSVTNRNINFGHVNSSSSIAAKITVTDSRGNQTTTSKNITVLAYSDPTAIISCKRQDNYQTATDLKVNAQYSSLDNKNEITIQYQTKKASSMIWGSLQTIQDGVTTTINLDNSFAWNVRVIVTDRLGEATYTLKVDKGTPIIFFDPVLRSVGVNCFPQYPESIELSGEDPFVFHAGQNTTLTGAVISGAISDSSQKLTFTLPLSKSDADVTPSLTSLKIDIRGVNGTLTSINEVVGASGYSISLTKSSDKLLTVEITKTTAFGYTDNTPVVVTAKATIAFS